MRGPLSWRMSWWNSAARLRIEPACRLSAMLGMVRTNDRIDKHMFARSKTLVHDRTLDSPDTPAGEDG